MGDDESVDVDEEVNANTKQAKVKVPKAENYELELDESEVSEEYTCETRGETEAENKKKVKGLQWNRAKTVNVDCRLKNPPKKEMTVIVEGAHKLRGKKLKVKKKKKEGEEDAEEVEAEVDPTTKQAVLELPEKEDFELELDTSDL